MPKPILLAALLLLLNTCSQSASPQRCSDFVSDGIRLKSSGSYREAITAFRKALSLAQEEGLGGFPLMQIYDHLASSCAEAGQEIEAAHQYRQALALLEKLEGKQSLDYALVLGKMTLLPRQSASDEQAIKVLQQALLTTATGEGVARKRLMAQSSLSQILIRNNRLAEAEHVLLNLKGTLITDPRGQEMLADALVELGMIRFHQSRYPEAQDFYLQSLQAHEAVDGSLHPHLIRPLNNLATAYARTGRFSEACSLYQRALSLCSNTLGESQFIYGILLQNYGDVMRKMGNRHEGNALREKGGLIQKSFLRRNGEGATIGLDALSAR